MIIERDATRSFYVRPTKDRMRYVIFGASGLNEREIKLVHKQDKAFILYANI